LIKILSESDVRAALRWEELIPAMARALADFSAGRVVQPTRNWLTLEQGQRHLGVMPAATDRAAGLKFVSLYQKNEGTRLPTVMATVLLVDPQTGEPAALVDATFLTAMRTAAVSAAVANAIAPRDAGVLAILGSGVEAGTHLEAIRSIRAIRDVRVWSRTPAHAASFAKSNGATAMSAEQAVRGADIVVCATATHTAVLEGAWLKPGAFVASIGAPMPEWREVDDAAMANIVVVDSREASLAEAGDVIQSRAKIYAEVGEIFAGTIAVPTGRTVIFKSNGLAVEDVVAAQIVLERSSGRVPGSS
jgi:thiomorpholine-carboxylate dehydrogenase